MTAMHGLNVNEAIGMLCHVAETIIDNKPLLTEVDSKIGDGDHGIGMAGGMQKAKEKVLTMTDTEDVYAVFKAAGNAMLMSMGGASGVIFGSMFMAGARGMDKAESISPEEFCAMMSRSLTAITERGGAHVGDKTMVDALAPAVEAMGSTKNNGFSQMLKAAEEAAYQGVENTKGYVARFGRAKSLMERAVGHQDAGATSVWLIFRAMREYAETVQYGE